MSPDFNKAKFKLSYHSTKGLKYKQIPQFAFIGRSNVGKSSLINALCGRKDLAKTSATPGKTQLINFFSVEDQLYLVDLPGYGYAKVSKKKREDFEGIISEYLLTSEKLYVVFILIDAAIPPQKIDLDFARWCGQNQIPVALIFTKTDKRKPVQITTNIQAFEIELTQFWEDLPERFTTSSNNKAGITELQEWIVKSFE